MGSIRPAGYNRAREDSEAKENNYMIQGDKGSASIGYGEANELASLNHNSSATATGLMMNPSSIN